MIPYKTKRMQTAVSQLAHSFNQRARDSSSLERTKEKAMIHRSKDGLNRGFSFCFIELFWPDFATFLRQIQKCESKSRGQ
jgi:hypothetical protein